MIKITFPDGSVREYNEGVTGLQIAESISSRLAQDVLACAVNGETIDLTRPINEDAEFVLYKWEDEQGKHAFWHTSAHLLAEALQELYPGIQFGIVGRIDKNRCCRIHFQYYCSETGGKICIYGSCTVNSVTMRYWCVY